MPVRWVWEKLQYGLRHVSALKCRLFAAYRGGSRECGEHEFGQADAPVDRLKAERSLIVQNHPRPLRRDAGECGDARLEEARAAFAETTQQEHRRQHAALHETERQRVHVPLDRKSTRLNSSN